MRAVNGGRQLNATNLIPETARRPLYPSRNRDGQSTNQAGPKTPGARISERRRSFSLPPTTFSRGGDDPRMKLQNSRANSTARNLTESR